MSTPRYTWWGYVKSIIRRYPRLCRENPAPESVGGREKQAVEQAIERTRRRRDGEERLRLIELVFWKESHTLAGAALCCHVSERTARRWHGEFIRLAALCFGLLDPETEPVTERVETGA